MLGQRRRRWPNIKPVLDLPQTILVVWVQDQYFHTCWHDLMCYWKLSDSRNYIMYTAQGLSAALVSTFSVAPEFSKIRHGMVKHLKKFKPEITSVISIRYMPRIAVAILDL